MERRTPYEISKQLAFYSSHMWSEPGQHPAGVLGFLINQQTPGHVILLPIAALLADDGQEPRPVPRDCVGGGAPA
jgi:hypothetical protein